MKKFLCLLLSAVMLLLLFGCAKGEKPSVRSGSELDIAEVTGTDHVDEDVTGTPDGELVTENFMIGKELDMSLFDGKKYELVNGGFVKELSGIKNNDLGSVSSVTLNRDMTAEFVYHDNSGLCDISLKGYYRFVYENTFTDEIENDAEIYFEFAGEFVEEVVGAFTTDGDLWISYIPDMPDMPYYNYFVGLYKAAK